MNWLRGGIFLWCASPVAVFLAAYTQWAGANIDTLSAWSGASMHSFGELSGNNPGGDSFGQTFKIKTGDAYAKSLAFKVDDYYPGTAPEICTFQVLIMRWNGSRPAGPVLFQSAPLVTHGGFAVYEAFSVPLNDTLLLKDQPYVAIFTANNYLNGIRSDASMANTGNLYPDGGFVAHYSGFSLGDLTAQNWFTGWEGSYDLVFNLAYEVVPEPGLGGLLLAGASVGWFQHRRKTQPSRGTA